MRRSASFGSTKPVKDPKKIVKPPWNNEIKDYSSYKLLPEELYKRRLNSQSKNLEAAKLSLLKKTLNLSANKSTIDTSGYPLEKTLAESPIKIQESKHENVTVSPCFINEVKSGMIVDLNVKRPTENKPTKLGNQTLRSAINGQNDITKEISKLTSELEEERIARKKLENEVVELKMLLSQVIKEILDVRCTIDKDFLEKLLQNSDV